MGRCALILLIIAISIPRVKAETICELLLPKPDTSFGISDFRYGYIKTGYNYQNLVNMRKSNGEHYYIDGQFVSLSTQFQGDLFFIGFDFNKPYQTFYANNIYNIDDYFKLTRNVPELIQTVGIRYGLFTVSGGLVYREKVGCHIDASVKIRDGSLGISGSIKPDINTFTYKIIDEKDDIPLNFYKNRVSLYYADKHLDTEVYYMGISVLNDDKNSYNSDIYGFSAGGFANTRFYMFKICTRFDYLDLSADLYYKGSPFGKLDALELYQYDSSFGVDFWKKYSISVGFTGLGTNVGDGSYFETWPFTFWDLFMPSKSKLDILDIDIVMPYIKIWLENDVKIKKLLLQPALGVSYYHLLMSRDIVYQKKVWKLYPFIAEYERHEKVLEPNFDGIFKLEFKLSSVFEMVHLDFNFTQLIPVKFSGKAKTGKTGGASSGTKTGGGSSIYISMTGYF